MTTTTRRKKTAPKPAAKKVVKKTKKVEDLLKDRQYFTAFYEGKKIKGRVEIDNDELDMYINLDTVDVYGQSEDVTIYENSLAGLESSNVEDFRVITKKEYDKINLTPDLEVGCQAFYLRDGKLKSGEYEYDIKTAKAAVGILIQLGKDERLANAVCEVVERFGKRDIKDELSTFVALQKKMKNMK